MNKKTFLTVILCLSAVFANAQRPQADEIQTGNGPLTIQPILHGTLVLKWNNKVIYIDPWGGAKAFEGIAGLHPRL